MISACTCGTWTDWSTCTVACGAGGSQTRVGTSCTGCTSGSSTSETRSCTGTNCGKTFNQVLCDLVFKYGINHFLKL